MIPGGSDIVIDSHLCSFPLLIFREINSSGHFAMSFTGVLGFGLVGGFEFDVRYTKV